MAKGEKKKRKIKYKPIGKNIELANKMIKPALDEFRNLLEKDGRPNRENFCVPAHMKYEAGIITLKANKLLDKALYKLGYLREKALDGGNLEYRELPKIHTSLQLQLSAARKDIASLGNINFYKTEPSPNETITEGPGDKRGKYIIIEKLYSFFKYSNK